MSESDSQHIRTQHMVKYILNSYTTFYFTFTKAKTHVHDNTINF